MPGARQEFLRMRRTESRKYRGGVPGEWKYSHKDILNRNHQQVYAAAPAVLCTLKMKEAT